MKDLKLTNTDFLLFRELVYKKIGINLSENKKPLVIARLTKRLRKSRFQSFRHYYNYLRDNKFPEEEMIALIDRITTRKTEFFRENHHFEFLKNVILPSLINAGKRKIRIWSAGCSSGEEPYSIAISIKEFFKNNPDIKDHFDIKILATDISHEALNHAIKGLYRQDLLLSMTAYLKLTYFNKIKDDDNTFYEAKEDLKKMITFGELNLIYNDFRFKSKFDLIFCRNVIIYFDKGKMLSLINKFYNCLHDKGYMFLGHSESLLSFREQFNYLKNTIYQKKI